MKKSVPMLLFPTFVSVRDLPVVAPKKLNSQLLQECQAFRDIDGPGRKWSRQNYFGGYTSYGTLCDLPDRSPTFAKLKAGLDRLAAEFARTLEMDLGNKKLEMSSCWINIMGTGSHHGSHLHPLSTLSGTYYVQVPEGSGAIKFEDPRLPMMMARPPSKGRTSLSQRRHVEVAPRVGQVVLFESWLKHEVPANRSETPRISISFNYDWV